MAQDYIYVVFVKAHTGLGKIARKLSGYEYTHIAVCLDKPLKEFITFSRRKHSAPFDCGFMRETLDCYAYGNHRGVKLKVVALPVSQKNRAQIEEYISLIENDDAYVFNFFSMLTMSFLHGLPIYKAHNCMSFVAKLIELSGAVKLEKKYYKYNISEMEDLLSGFTSREGIACKKKIETVNYMEHVSILRNICLFIKLNSTLISRLISYQINE